MFKISILIVFILIYCWKAKGSVPSARKSVQISTIMPLNSVQVTDTCVLYNCSVTCGKRKYEQLEWNIRQTIAFAHYCPIIEKLHLTKYQFPNATIPNAFLGSFQNRVRSLVLTSSNISHIEEGAFANGVFEQITLEDLKFTELHSSYFKNMSAVLESLTIKQIVNNTRLSMQTDFLDSIRSQLKVLRLQVQAKTFYSILLQGDFSNLTSLDLSHNQLANRLQSNTFMRFCAIKYLNLSKCKISYLPSHIFSYIMDTLVYLDLSHNSLTQLWPTMFGFHQIPATITINTQFNKWTCCCKAYTLMMQLFPQIDEMFCQDVNNNNEERLVDISLCFQQELLPTTNMFSTITEATQGSENKTINFCKIILESQERTLRNKTYLMSAYDVQLQTLEKLINFLKTIPEKYGLVYFNQETSIYYSFDNKANKTENLAQLYAAITALASFKQNVPYTACLVPNNEVLLNPLNCMTIYKRSTNNEHSWLTNNNKMLAISIVLSSIIAFLFVGLITVYVMIRLRPSLIRGSKRIIRSKTHAQSIVVLPKRSSKKILQEKELQLAQSKNVTHIIAANMDTTSFNSADSYMNENIYELVPAYLKLREEPIKLHSSSLCETEDEELYNCLPAMDQF